MADTMRKKYRTLTEEEKKHLRKLKEKGEDLHNYIESLGSLRETSIAKTKLEEAVMWATKHITY